MNKKNEYNYMYTNRDEALKWYLHIAEFLGIRMDLVSGRIPFSEEYFEFQIPQMIKYQADYTSPLQGSYQVSTKGVRVKDSLGKDDHLFKWSEVTSKLFETIYEHNTLLPYPFDTCLLKETMSEQEGLVVSRAILQEKYCFKYFKELTFNDESINKLSFEAFWDNLETSISSNYDSFLYVWDLESKKVKDVSLDQGYKLKGDEVRIYPIYSSKTQELIGYYSISCDSQFQIILLDKSSSENECGTSPCFKVYSYNLKSLSEDIFKNINVFFKEMSQTDVWLRSQFSVKENFQKEVLSKEQEDFLNILSNMPETEDIVTGYFSEVEIPKTKLFQLSFL